MSWDMAHMVLNLKRTATHASYSMTVDTTMVRKLIAAAELAEAELAYVEVSDAEYDQWAYDATATALHDARDAYRAATR